MDSKVFEIKGDLWLFCQEGGFAFDGWELRGGDDMPDVDLADVLAQHFGVERMQYSGDRHIGLVKIIVERLITLA